MSVRPHDPGDPGPRPVGPGDPAVSRVTYALRDLGIEGQASAEAVLEVLGDGELSQVQRYAVLAAWPRPEQRRATCEVCGGGVMEDPPGLWRHVEAAERAHDAWPGRELISPYHELHDQGDDDPAGVSWAQRD